ncbi:MAG: hypothetical protein M1294_10320 [Firmicutes bacterium]|uniref:Transposase n=1 Tax=Sulfobacillus benefaciens TaxID=453960 RepID=A0A2T2WUU3_9FIRM|nr:hypothetical protein [Bacillota bacterium]MCL5013196.1 hypothetical protein [Bacillota bacterium]PSR26001.1 MAG: hypothetical protein C7B43_15425 [Sulfobacillus benefaciens]
MPREPTVRRVLQQLDVDALATVLAQWLAAASPAGRETIAFDEKSVRGSGHGACKRSVYLLSALVHRTGRVIGRGFSHWE